MFGPHNQSVDNEASRSPQAAHNGPEQDGGSSPFEGTATATLSRLAQSANIGASYNAPVRTTAVQRMQQTHGNRAVQRAVSTSRSGGRVPVQRDGPVQEEQVNPASSFMYQPQPFAPIPSPMNDFGGTIPFGPVAAPVSEPVYGPQLEGGVSTMEDGAFQDAALMDGSREDPEARAEAIREAMSAAFDDGNGDSVPMPYSGEDGGVCEVPGNAPNQDVVQANNSGESSSDFGVGDANNMVSAGTTTANMLMMGSSAFKDVGTVAEDFNVLSLAKGGSGALNTGSSALGVGLGIYNFATAKDNSERVQAGADTLASGAGFLGPVGSAFSGGYSAGQLLDKGADWVGDKIWGEGDHSLHHGIAEHVLPHILPPAQDIRDAWEVFRGRGTEAQQENAERRKDEVELDHIREARKDRERKAQDEQEMEEMRSQIAHPHIGGTMLGTPGDALSGSSIAAQFMPHQVDEDGVPLPPVSMALPPTHR